MEEQVVKKKSKGKHKIAIEAIKNKTQLQVTFSKRRTGLFKKGSELCTLCGAKIAIVTFSPAGKLFSFGHPSAEAVIQRYINNGVNCNNYGNNGNICVKSVEEYMDVTSQIEAEKRASTSASNNGNNGRDYRFWWDKNIDDLGLVDLQHFKVALEGLRDEVVTRVDQINRLSMSLVPQNFEFGSRDGNTVAHCENSDESGRRLNDESLMSLVPQKFNVGTRDSNSVAHCKSVDGSTGPWMSVVPHNLDVGTRDGNTVAHCKKIDGSTSTTDQSLMSLVVGTRDGNNVAHYKGFDESTTHWIDQDDFHHGLPPVYSFHDMLVKKED